jgi:hypothetical protein
MILDVVSLAHKSAAASLTTVPVAPRIQAFFAEPGHIPIDDGNVNYLID